jgi:hypothetical protein
MTSKGSDLDGKLRRIAQRHPVDPRCVLLLVCPPVYRWRLRAAAYLPKFILCPLHLESDFVRSHLDRGISIERYWREVGQDAARMVHMIRKTRVQVVLNARWRDFAQLARSRYEIVFLVAHHPRNAELIEFADSVRHWSEVRSLLPQAGASSPNSFLLDVCSSSHWRDELRRRYPDMKTGGGPNEMNFLQSLKMIGLFAGSCDGKRSFEDAWSLAEAAYWNPGSEM